MTRSRSTSVLTVIVLALATALGLKVLRYTDPPQRMDQAFETRLDGLLTGEGWQRQPQDPETRNSAVQIITFKKQGCTEPLRVSIVGTTSGLESFLRQKFGDDLAFVQHGTVRDRPSLLHYQVMRNWQAAKAFLTGTTLTSQPILAVIPAPKKATNFAPSPEPCTPPAVQFWQRL